MKNAKAGSANSSAASSRSTKGIEFSNADGRELARVGRSTRYVTYNLATVGDVLYAGRVDGLWRRPIDNVSAVTAVGWRSAKSLYK